VNQQSLEEFEKHFETITNESVFVLSIAPQSRASLAAHYNTNITDALAKLTHFFKTHFGAKYVLDTNWSRHFTHLEICHEFIAKYHSKDTPLLARYAFILTLTISACPGFVCYAEKSHGETILPLISSTKSPMQVMGSIVKTYLARKTNTKPSNIYHVSVMMCFDKKLEASRDDFLYDPTDPNAHEVDMVLTSSEVVELLTKKGITNAEEFAKLPNATIDHEFTELEKLGDLLVPTNGPLVQSTGSGGYAEIVFRYASKELFGITQPRDLVFKTGRNSDIKELILINPTDGQVLLKFAIANGFRNIQNIIRRMKKGAKGGYDFVEVMACPSGCLNGGGQIAAPESSNKKDYLQLVSDLYFSNDQPVTDDFSALVDRTKALYDEWIGGGIYSEPSKKILHTQYHAREKLSINPLTIKW
jgi:iron only hydrogenase large subunit-like protein